MRLHCPQVTWHGGEQGKNAPILSIDFHPTDRHLVVTGGADGETRLWVLDSEGDASPRFLNALPGHESSVNCVRWSPNGSAVAAGADGGAIIWWSLPAQTDHTKAKPSWRSIADSALKKLMVVQHDDVYDLSWSPGGHLIAAASINHTCCVWDAERRSLVNQLRDHAHFVQGVAWDPHGALLATQSSDRTVRVYGSSSSAADAKALEKKRSAAAKKGEPKPAPLLPGWPQASSDGVDKLVSSLKCTRAIKFLQEPSPVNAEAGNTAATEAVNKAAAATAAASAASEIPGGNSVVVGDLCDATASSSATEDGSSSTTTAAPADGSSGVKRADKKANLFCDETVPTFFRRLSWTPDGAFLIAPTGIYAPPAGDANSGGNTKPCYATWLFSRTQLDSPAICLPGLSRPSVAVRCSPRLYKARSGGAASLQPPASPTGVSGLNDIDTHRCVFAVLTLNEVLVYDTHQGNPLCIAQRLHYAALTDAAWSCDGRTLAVASRDGYVSVIHFSEAELGICHDRSAVESWLPKSRHAQAIPPKPKPTPATAAAAASTSSAAALNTTVATGAAATGASTTAAAVPAAMMAVDGDSNKAPGTAQARSATASPAGTTTAGTTFGAAPAPAKATAGSTMHVLTAKKKKQRIAPVPCGVVASSPTPAPSSSSSSSSSSSFVAPSPMATPTNLAPLSAVPNGSGNTGGFTPRGAPPQGGEDLFSPPLVAPTGSPSSGGDAAGDRAVLAAPSSSSSSLHKSAAVNLEAVAVGTEGGERPTKKRITPMPV